MPPRKMANRMTEDRLTLQNKAAFVPMLENYTLGHVVCSIRKDILPSI